MVAVWRRILNEENDNINKLRNSKDILSFKKIKPLKTKRCLYCEELFRTRVKRYGSSRACPKCKGRKYFFDDDEIMVEDEPNYGMSKHDERKKI